MSKEGWRRVVAGPWWGWENQWISWRAGLGKVEPRCGRRQKAKIQFDFQTRTLSLLPGEWILGWVELGHWAAPKHWWQKLFILGDRLMWEATREGGRRTLRVRRGGEVQTEKKPTKPVKEWVKPRRHKRTIDYKPEKKWNSDTGEPGKHYSKHKRARVQSAYMRYSEKSDSKGQTEGWSPRAGSCHLMAIWIQLGVEWDGGQWWTGLLSSVLHATKLYT